MTNLNSLNLGTTLSIVSHGQIALVRDLLEDLQRLCVDKNFPFEVILTFNIPEQVPFDLHSFSFPIRIVFNVSRKGFGSNHNQAFKLSKGRFFCVINPDIRLIHNPFPLLITNLANHVGVVAPLVQNSHGEMEDTARQFPTPWSIIFKALKHFFGRPTRQSEFVFKPDWVGGMFMLFDHDVFQDANGFDERYFLYYEDVDLCARLRLKDLAVQWLPEVVVVHEARFSSHQNFRYALWHLQSMTRFFISKPFRKILYLKLTNQ
jgi:N-acetylglucosaminyl-diphospho-decaprenol L-rhamnosyltransferase